eukprot:6721015-Prymnesium_polylepis.1
MRRMRACSFCSGSNLVVSDARSSDQTKTEPRSLATASLVASLLIETERIALLPSGTSSAEHVFCAMSQIRMLPSRSPEMSSPLRLARRHGDKCGCVAGAVHSNGGPASGAVWPARTRGRKGARRGVHTLWKGW